MAVVVTLTKILASGLGPLNSALRASNRRSLGQRGPTFFLGCTHLGEPKKSVAVVPSAKILVSGLDPLNSVLRTSNSRWFLTPSNCRFVNASSTKAAIFERARLGDEGVSLALRQAQSEALV